MLRTPANIAFVLIALVAYFGPRLAGGGVPQGSSSALHFEAPHWDAGRLLEGAVVTHTFAGVNRSDQAIRITGAHHCSCLRLEIPDGPIAPGAHFDVIAHLDTTRRSGRLTKPIDLETDEGSKLKARLSAVAQVDSPMLMRPPQLVVRGTRAGEVTVHVLRGILDPRASNPRVHDGGGAADPLLESVTLAPMEGNELRLTVQVHTQGHSQNGEVLLDCDFVGQTWTLKVPIRVIVRDALIVFPSRLRLTPGRSRKVQVQNSFPEEFGIGEVTVSHPDALTVRELERDEKTLRLEVQRVEGVPAPAEPVTLTVGTDHEDFPPVTIPVEFVK